MTFKPLKKPISSKARFKWLKNMEKKTELCPKLAFLWVKSQKLDIFYKIKIKNWTVCWFTYFALFLQQNKQIWSVQSIFRFCRTNWSLCRNFFNLRFRNFGSPGCRTNWSTPVGFIRLSSFIWHLNGRFLALALALRPGGTYGNRFSVFRNTFFVWGQFNGIFWQVKVHFWECFCIFWN